MNKLQRSFLEGFDYGMRTNSKELTTKEILEQWPTVNVDAFAEGMKDGLARDDFRYNRIPSF